MYSKPEAAKKFVENVSEFPARLPGADHHILIPDGVYVSEYVGAVGFYYLGSSPRVAVCFRITEEVGTEQQILGFYKVIALRSNGVSVKKNKRIRNPEFRIGWRSRLARDLGTLFPEYSPSNLPKNMPIIDGRVLIKTATVREDRDGADRPERFWSSKVDRIEGWASGE